MGYRIYRKMENKFKIIHSIHSETETINIFNSIIDKEYRKKDIRGLALAYSIISNYSIKQYGIRRDLVLDYVKCLALPYFDYDSLKISSHSLDNLKSIIRNRQISYSKGEAND